MVRFNILFEFSMFLSLLSTAQSKQTISVEICRLHQRKTADNNASYYLNSCTSLSLGFCRVDKVL